MTIQTDAQDEYFLDTPAVRGFIAEVRRTLAAQSDVAAGLAALRPRFAALLADQTWLPDEFAAPYAESKMGGAIGTWLLFRAADSSLSLFSLVVPAGAETPIHDHLAWGLVGLYRGAQTETVYQRTDDGADEARATLDIAEVNLLAPGHFYTLLPPDGDIHAVKTTSGEASVSIHLLANDTGCVVRHAFDPAHDHVRQFRSGYSNVACADDSASHQGSEEGTGRT